MTPRSYLSPPYPCQYIVSRHCRQAIRPVTNAPSPTCPGPTTACACRCGCARGLVPTPTARGASSLHGWRAPQPRVGSRGEPEHVAAPVPPAAGPVFPTPTLLGMDDFVLRKRETYGTVQIDLEHRQPVALLPGRTADPFAQWLWEHPGVTIIVRDRSPAYADGTAKGRL